MREQRSESGDGEAVARSEGVKSASAPASSHQMAASEEYMSAEVDYGYSDLDFSERAFGGDKGVGD